MSFDDYPRVTPKSLRILVYSAMALDYFVHKHLREQKYDFLTLKPEYWIYGQTNSIKLLGLGERMFKIRPFYSFVLGLRWNVIVKCMRLGMISKFIEKAPVLDFICNLNLFSYMNIWHWKRRNQPRQSKLFAYNFPRSSIRRHFNSPFYPKKDFGGNCEKMKWPKPKKCCSIRDVPSTEVF